MYFKTQKAKENNNSTNVLNSIIKVFNLLDSGETDDGTVMTKELLENFTITNINKKL